MTKFKLNSNFQNRFEKFLSSDLFHNQSKHAKTAYWQHHSKKDAKRKLKPQALRSARQKRRQLINRLLNRPQGRFFSIIRISNKNINV